MSARDQRPAWWELLFVALLVAAYVAQAGLGSQGKSASFDEQYHLTSGYAYLRTGDFRLATTHPPLAGMLAAVPLLSRTDITLPLDSPLWAEGRRYDFSDAFLWDANGERAAGMLVQARWGITALGAVLLLAVWAWGRRLFGRWGGLLALTLAALDPNLVANGRIVSTDLPVTALLFLALWRVWCWLERPRWFDIILAGVLGGLAMAAKYNGLLVWPIALAMALLYPWRRRTTPSGMAVQGDSSNQGRTAIPDGVRRLGGLAAMGGIGLLTLWAVYGFDVRAPGLLGVSVPLPLGFYWEHLWGTLTGLLDENTFKPDFLLGEVSTGGWWYYFPVALGLKTPLALWVLFLAGVAAMVRGRAVRRLGALWLPPLALLLMGLTGILTIGYRHMLPALPFAMVLAAHSVTWARRAAGAGEGVGAQGMARRVANPPYAGVGDGVGAAGQGAAAGAGEGVGAQGMARRVANPPYAGAGDGVGAAGQGEAGGAGSWRWPVVAVGALLVGWLVLGALRIYPHQEAYFNELAGDWRNWSNLLVDSNLDWGQDLPALREVMAARGIDTVNLAYFGKAVPERYGVSYRPLPGYLRFMEGREVNAYNPYTPEPGWYAVSATALRLGTLQPDTVDLYSSFRSLEPVDRAGYSIYLYRVDDAPGTQVVRPVVVDTPVHRLTPEDLGVAPGVRAQAKWLQNGATAVYPQGQDLVLPAGDAYHRVNANLGGVFTLLGYTLTPESVQPGTAAEITLYWQVGERPMPQPMPTRGAPVSTFVHVIDGDPGTRVAQADGWEVALHGLEPGDVIVQKMSLDFAPETAAKSYQILVGLYSPQDGSRLKITGSDQDFVELGQVSVDRQE